ncbi:unnamed protein product [Caenorhabditis angaria]|uniref:Uncharacterized protein n=1 Tax=Caenorhabditis angaria TaxID=860376 RepID=A0A9P1N466_9PELO|nr:unnamed protein product [Caenorhabditis angaria]
MSSERNTTSTSDNAEQLPLTTLNSTSTTERVPTPENALASTNIQAQASNEQPQLPLTNLNSPSATERVPTPEIAAAPVQADLNAQQDIGEDGRARGNQLWAENAHEAEADRILRETLEIYKKVFKRVIAKYVLFIILWILVFLFSMFSISCWSEHLELIEHLEVYDKRYIKKYQKSKNANSVDMDCPIIGVIGKFWTPNSSHVDLVGKILSIISIREIVHLIKEVNEAIKYKTIPLDEAAKKRDKFLKFCKRHGIQVVEQAAG